MIGIFADNILLDLIILILLLFYKNVNEQDIVKHLN